MKTAIFKSFHEALYEFEIDSDPPDSLYGCPAFFSFFSTIQKLFQMRTFIFFFLFPVILQGQIKHDYIWLLGTQGKSSNNPSLFGLDILDFNDGNLMVGREYWEGNFFATAGSISNIEGELLFYSDGCKIYTKEGEVMENGSGLNPGVAYSTGNCPDEGNAIAKGLMILPLPGDSSRYYVFHEAVEAGTPGTVYSIHLAKLYYSLVDMEENGGLGRVIEKNKVVIADTLHSDMHAVRHANGEDWWLLFGKGNKPLIFSVLFTKDGVAGVFEQEVGPQPDPWFSGGGMTSFSPDGTRYARYYRNEQLSLFDFDRETGLLGNFRQFHADTTGGDRGGLSFSASGRYLYVNTSTRLVQFDLEASDVQASRTVVGEYDGYLWNDQLPTVFGQMQLAPDCKVYMSTPSGSDVLHVIHRPDEPGLACGFVQHEFHLPAINTYTISNFPNYRLGTPYPVCDSTIQPVTSSVRVLPPQWEVAVYPNPASGQVTLEMSQALDTESEWSLYSAVGQRVFSHKMERGARRETIPLGGVPQGAVLLGNEKRGY